LGCIVSIFAQLALRSSLCVWLAFAAPILCQYHGLIWPAARESATLTDADSAPDAQHTHHHQHPVSSMPVVSDQSVPDTPCAARCVLPLTHNNDGLLALMNLFVATMPAATVYLPLTTTGRVSPERFRFPQQREPAPPEMPPKGMRQ
jgi:hypothetical protein